MAVLLYIVAFSACWSAQTAASRVPEAGNFIRSSAAWLAPVA
jgi:hypothetical protein